MKLDAYTISTALRRIENGVVIFPIYMEVQTTSTVIEQYCAKNFPNLINFHEFTMEEMYQLAKMKAYIKNNLSAVDKKEILGVLQTKGWLNNIGTDLYKLKILETRCRMAADKLPFLLINMEISFDIKTIIKYYINKKWLNIRRSQNNLTKETAEIYFIQPLPYMLAFERSFDIKNEILKVIIDVLKTKSLLSTQLDDAIGLQNTNSLKKDIAWQDDRILKVVINDTLGLLKAKAKKNWIPLTFAAIVAYDKLNQKKKKKILLQQINVFEKIQNLVAVAKDKNI